jgi:hypothetical protein
MQIRTYKTIILHVALYGCATCSLVLTEEHRLRVSQKRGLRTIFGPKRDEVTGRRKKLHNEELHNLLYSNISFQGDQTKQEETGVAFCIL